MNYSVVQSSDSRPRRTSHMRIICSMLNLSSSSSSSSKPTPGDSVISLHRTCPFKSKSLRLWAEARQHRPSHQSHLEAARGMDPEISHILAFASMREISSGSAHPAKKAARWCKNHSENFSSSRRTIRDVEPCIAATTTNMCILPQARVDR